MAIRVVAAARDAELWERRAGWEGAAGVLAHRRGGAHDPAVVDAVLHGGERLVADRRGPHGPGPRRRAGTGADTWPGPARCRAGSGCRLRRPEVAVPARPLHRGLPPRRRRRPGRRLVGRGRNRDRSGSAWHDVGRVGVASGIWDHPGPLGAEQWERVRLHAYLTERVMHRSDLLAPFAGLAARHHERADGSGYHRGSAGDQLSLSARLLAAADTYHAMTEARAHRPGGAPGPGRFGAARPGRHGPLLPSRGRRRTRRRRGGEPAGERGPPGRPHRNARCTCYD